MDTLCSQLISCSTSQLVSRLLVLVGEGAARARAPAGVIRAALLLGLLGVGARLEAGRPPCCWLAGG
jgi:hypothetical protein